MMRKLLIGLGGLAAVVLLAVFVVMPLLSEDEEDPRDPAEIAAERAAAEDDGPADDPGDEVEPDPVEETFEVFTARDPFQQLVQDGGATTASTDPGTSNGEVSQVDDDDDDGDETPGSGATVEGTTVELVEVFEDDDGTETAQVTVNDTGYEVTEGDEFAGRFRVLDIDGQCATFLYGDQRFTLCEGESIRK